MISHYSFPTDLPSMYDMKPYTRSTKMANLNTRKEMLPLREDFTDSLSLYSRQSHPHMDMHSIFSDDSCQTKKRFPKNALNTDKVMLKYCGRRHPDSSPDESHSCSFEYNSEHDHHHSDTYHGFSEIDTRNHSFDNDIASYCQICYKCEKDRCAELGYQVPHPSNTGPWKTHRIRDASGNPECPLFYFQACLCGFYGSMVHPPSKCPFVQAIGQL